MSKFANINLELAKALNAVTKSCKHVVRIVSASDIETLKAIGTDSWVEYNNSQVCWSDRGNGKWAIYSL